MTSFEGDKADCLNGGKHEWKQRRGFPNAYFVGMYRCSACDTEECHDEEGRKAALAEYKNSLR